MDAPDITLKVCQTLNPTLLPAVENGNSLHQCTETVKRLILSDPVFWMNPMTTLRLNGSLTGVVYRDGNPNAGCYS